MRHSVFWQTLHETRRSLMYWTLSLSGAAGLILLAYPLLVRITGSQSVLQDLPAWLGFILGESASPVEAGRWMELAGFGLVLPLGLVIFTIYQGSGLVAGEEERGTLGLLLSAPLKRKRLIFEKYAVLVLLALVPAAGIWLVVSPVRWLGWLPMKGLTLLWDSFILFLIGLAFGALAMALGSLTGKSWLSFGITLAFALPMLLASRLPDSLSIQPILRFFSPFYYYRVALLTPLSWGHVLVLALVAVAGLVLAWKIFEQRDLPA